jgi:hypothetical protein
MFRRLRFVTIRKEACQRRLGTRRYDPWDDTFARSEYLLPGGSGNGQRVNELGNLLFIEAAIRKFSLRAPEHNVLGVSVLRKAPGEPAWDCRRLFGLSHAAMAGCSSLRTAG